MSDRERSAAAMLKGKARQDFESASPTLRRQMTAALLGNRDSRGGSRQQFTTGYLPGSRKYPYGR